MADTKQSAFTALTGANMAAGDGVPVLDVSDTTMGAGGTNKSMTRTEFKAGINLVSPTKQILTVGSGTYNTPTGCTLIKITVVGGGAGGGGVAGSTTNAGAGGGGGGASAAIKWIASPSSSYAYTTGAKGAGGSAGANNGIAGNDSTFGAGGGLITAKGGGAGPAGVLGTTALANSYIRGGVGGAVSTGGDINTMGYEGGAGVRNAATDTKGNFGGSSIFGGGAQEPNSNAAGNAASTPGSGGSGGKVESVNTNRAGGDGADGVILVEEYYA